jgi:hypothetical protein
MKSRALLSGLALGMISAVVPTASAQASLVLIGTFDGNQCGGAGGFTACYASGTTAGNGSISKTAGGSPSIIRIDSDSSKNDKSTFFTSIAGNELVISYNSGNNTLTYTYTATGADPVAHYLGLFNGGGAASGTGTGFNNTYDLFYDPNGITTGTIQLSDYFNNRGWSHVDLFDTGSPGVPEPASWALMLLGFAGVGAALRRSRKAELAQVA